MGDCALARLVVAAAAVTVVACGARATTSDLGGIGAGGYWTWDLGVTPGAAGGSTSVGAGGADVDLVGGAAGAVAGAAGSAGPPRIPPMPPWPSPTGCPAAANYPVVGTWNGYIENAPPPWDSIHLAINGLSQVGGACGTVTLGSAPPLAPATDPNLGYPPSLQGVGVGPPVIEGYPFTMVVANAIPTQIHFGIAIFREPWVRWCELQSVLYPTGSAAVGYEYGCAPNWPIYSLLDSANTCSLIDPETGQNLAMDCSKATLCRYPVCRCDATACTAAPTADVSCDLVLNGSELTGTCTAATGTARFVRAD